MSDEVKNDFLRRWEIDNTKYSTKSNADKTKLKMELKTLDEKQMNLLDAYLDHTITNEEYTAVKQKIINRKVEINECLKDKAKNRLGLPPRGAKSVLVVGKSVANNHRKNGISGIERDTGIGPAS